MIDMIYTNMSDSLLMFQIPLNFYLFNTLHTFGQYIFSAKVAGTKKSDFIGGRKGDDTLAGKKGDDLLIGGSGQDVLTGSKGKDYLDGSKGNDILNGGKGADVFQISKGIDLVKDFSLKQGDRIALDKKGKYTIVDDTDGVLIMASAKKQLLLDGVEFDDVVAAANDLFVQPV